MPIAQYKPNENESDMFSKEIILFGESMLIEIGDDKHYIDQHLRIVVLAHIRHCLELSDAVYSLLKLKSLVSCESA